MLPIRQHIAEKCHDRIPLKLHKVRPQPVPFTAGTETRSTMDGRFYVGWPSAAAKLWANQIHHRIYETDHLVSERKVQILVKDKAAGIFRPQA
jgi:hypothetical protein